MTQQDQHGSTVSSSLSSVIGPKEVLSKDPLEIARSLSGLLDKMIQYLPTDISQGAIIAETLVKVGAVRGRTPGHPAYTALASISLSRVTEALMLLPDRGKAASLVIENVDKVLGTLEGLTHDGALTNPNRNHSPHIHESAEWQIELCKSAALVGDLGKVFQIITRFTDQARFSQKFVDDVYDKSWGTFTQTAEEVFRAYLKFNGPKTVDSAVAIYQDTIGKIELIKNPPRKGHDLKQSWQEAILQELVSFIALNEPGQLTDFISAANSLNDGDMKSVMTTLKTHVAAMHGIAAQQLLVDSGHSSCVFTRGAVDLGLFRHRDGNPTLQDMVADAVTQAYNNGYAAGDHDSPGRMKPC